MCHVLSLPVWRGGTRRRELSSETGRRRMPGIPDPSPDVTALLLGWRSGDEAAPGRIVPLVHDELRKDRASLPARRAGPEPAGDGAGQRGLPAAGGCTARELAEPGSLPG